MPVRRHVVAPRERGRGVKLAGHGLSGAGGAPRGGQHVARADERLGRHAAPVGALPADQLPLDQGDAQPAVGQPPGSVLAGRPGPDHDHVEGLRHLRPSSPAR
jgi:hypothetical protein